MVLLLLLSLALVLLSGDGVPDAAGQLACAVRAASASRVTRVPRVMQLRLFLLLVFVYFVDPDALVCALFAVAGSKTCAGRRATRLCYYDGDRHGGGR